MIKSILTATYKVHTKYILKDTKQCCVCIYFILFILKSIYFFLLKVNIFVLPLSEDEGENDDEIDEEVGEEDDDDEDHNDYDEEEEEEEDTESDQLYHLGSFTFISLFRSCTNFFFSLLHFRRNLKYFSLRDQFFQVEITFYGK